MPGRMHDAEATRGNGHLTGALLRRGNSAVRRAKAF